MNLFEPADKPRIFAVPPGYDFAAEFVAGLRQRLNGSPPETMASILVFLNTRRVRQGIRSEFANGAPGFLPRLRLVTDLATDPGFPDIPAPVEPLRRRLELSQAVGRLLKGDERFASRAVIYDLADSLANLLDEMHAEGVDPNRIRELDVSEHSEHWARSLEFIDIIERHWGLNAQPDIQARQRLVVERIVESWEAGPPDHPVIVAGSTGSRGATQLLMQAAARLPQGAVVVPCFDFEMPEETWATMDDMSTGEDHPQYRLKFLMDSLGVGPGDVEIWRRGSTGGNSRNRLISLALRPAPVTDQWMTEGPALGDICEATEGLTLLEAPDPRMEAVSISLCMREAVENGENVSLVTPDRILARQVTAALKRWKITPFDSSGEILLHTMPGRFLHAIADILGRENPDPVSLVALLKHPMTHAGKGREFHRRETGKLERALRDRDAGSSAETVLADLRRDVEPESAEEHWLDWLNGFLSRTTGLPTAGLSEFVQLHETLSGILWRGSRMEEGRIPQDTAAGRAALATFEELDAASDAAGQLTCADYAHLFRSIAARNVVWQPFTAHSLVSIWDTIDARMQSPDIVIAGGLNNGTWPVQPKADPWLNRDMRREAGLLLPERMTGLRAHDFQQAVSAKKVVLSRCLRNVDAPTVPSRWLSRIISLLGGLEGDGESALKQMRLRGQEILRRARLMEQPAAFLKPETRPEPRPPVKARPRRLSVTEIRTLITNPYEVYAKRVLGLRELNPLGGGTEVQLRGTVVHDILHRFVQETLESNADCTPEKLMGIAREKFSATDLPSHVTTFWLAQMDKMAGEFVELEIRRRSRAEPYLLECKGGYWFPDLDFTLTARADRIDRSGQRYFLYDYKTGTIPTKAQVDRYDKQLPLTAMMIENGAFTEVSNGTVPASAYIGAGREAKEVDIPRMIAQEGEQIDRYAQDWARLGKMLEAYLDEKTPFIARRYVETRDFGQAYHHLARFGEWDDTAGLKNEPWS